MDETYKKAVCVSVWLGLIPGAEQWRRRLNTPGPIRTFDADPFEWTDYISDLANRPYWSRFWVIQEFLLCENVNIYCSGNQIDWFRFKEILGYETNINIVSDTESLGLGNAIADSHAAIPLVMGRHPDKHPEFLRPLHELLVEHHRSKSKDPRDRVFALLGLIPHDERRLIQRLLPEYSLSEDHVAIIALAHVLLFNRFNHRDELVTTDSDELFRGLGIERRTCRRRLLRRAKDLDYVGCDELGYFLAQMELTDFDENARYDEDRNWEAEDGPETESSTVSFMMIFLLVVILGLGTWLYWSGKIL